MKIDPRITTETLFPATQRVFQTAAEKALALDHAWNPKHGTPVFTVEGRYTTRGWTEWTQGFQFGLLILSGDGLQRADLMMRGRNQTQAHMLPHVTHTGVHDHGFNVLSTYGNLLRLWHEGRLDVDEAEACGYRQLIAVSGAVQAARWATLNPAEGFVYSFNGPHSLFVDTLRSMRILMAAHRFGHVLMTENDQRVNLLHRALVHGLITDRYLVFHGDSEHGYDVRGRTAHEAIFNRNDGQFRSRATQQGYSPFSTWTRGLAWAMLGFAEQLEFLQSAGVALPAQILGLSRREWRQRFLRAAIDTCDHYIQDVTALDGIPYWDDGAPNLYRLDNWRERPADPWNDWEPVDASAAAIAAQGLLRLGRVLGKTRGRRYTQAGLTVARTLMAPPYLCDAPRHQGLLRHSVYHWPNRWDFIPSGQAVTAGESSLWGDYHLLELALWLRRAHSGEPYPTFFSG